jgi:predicted NAD-dependent protein-ADP-ribosyltransferase YbiA (DUF1768 family)
LLQLWEGILAMSANGYGCVKPDTDKQVFFYEQDFYVLSNFSAFQVRWMGIDFATSEHVYHWEKFAHITVAPRTIRKSSAKSASLDQRTMPSRLPKNTAPPAGPIGIA